jgi:hypothetical protein
MTTTRSRRTKKAKKKQKKKNPFQQAGRWSVYSLQMSVTWSDAPEDILVEVLRLAGPRIIGLFGLLSKGSENLQRISTLHAMWEHVRNDCGAFVDTTASLQEQKRSLMMGFNSIENLRQVCNGILSCF